MKISRQIEVNIYISDVNNLCIAVDDDDLVDIDGKKVIIQHSQIRGPYESLS